MLVGNAVLPALLDPLNPAHNFGFSAELRRKNRQPRRLPNTCKTLPIWRVYRAQHLVVGARLILPA